VAFDLLRDALSAIFGLSELKHAPDPYSAATQFGGVTRTLQDMSRTMLNEQSLPQKFGVMLKAYIILNKHTRKVKESLDVTFDETPPPSKTSPLVDDDLDEEEAIKVTKKKILENDIVDETLEIDEIVNIKESRNHPLENVIGNLNQRTLRSQTQNQSNFFCFISTIEPKKALRDKSWIVAMQEELNQFVANNVWELVAQPRNMTIIGTKWVFRNKLDKNGIVSRNKAKCRLSYSDEGQMFVEFVIQNQYFSLSLEDFAQILIIPCEGVCVFSDRWSLDELVYGAHLEVPYQTNLPFPDDIISYVQEDLEGQVTRIHHQEEVMVQDYQILTREIMSTLKPLEEIIQENVFCLGGNRDYVPACLCYMLYCVANSEKFNLAYFMTKRMEWVTKQARLILPYEQNPRRDRGTRRGRPSTSSSTFDQPSSSHLNDDDDDGNDEGTSRSSSPLLSSSSSSLHHSTMNSTNASSSNPSKKIKLTVIPPRQLFVNISSDEDITTTPSPTTTSSSPTPPNAPSKTTSTNQTSSSQENTSSSFHSKLQISPPSSHELNSPHHLNPLIDNILDVPPRPLNPQPLQSHPSLDITLFFVPNHSS
ncbi:hypothetical protein Tco_0913897, partial [Tanacetum coccineum]